MNGPQRILLVDDNPLDRTLVLRALRRQMPALQAEQISGPADFARALAGGRADLVVTDYQLLWTDGLAVLRAVKAQWPACPVVMFTGTGSEEIAVEAMKGGLDDYVLKSPRHLDRLAAAVQLALARAQDRQARAEAERALTQRQEELREANQRLQALSWRLLAVQEEERRKIARELHDEVGQLLTGLRLAIAMSAHLPASTAKDSLAEAHTLVSDLLARVRQMSLDLRPAILDDLGLLPAVEGHCQRYTAQTRVAVSLQHSGLEGRRFPPEVETAAYRIVQEGLTNVARYAATNAAVVRLRADESTLSVEIEDQGAGFDPQEALRAGSSSGLSGMQERASLLGGRLTISAAPGAGTRLKAELPLPGDRR